MCCGGPAISCPSACSHHRLCHLSGIVHRDTRQSKLDLGVVASRIKPGTEYYQVERRSGESSEGLMKAEGSIAEWARARPYKWIIKIFFFFPILSLWPLMANILNPRGFAMEALADFSVLRFPAIAVHGFGSFDFLYPADIWLVSWYMECLLAFIAITSF